MVGVGAIWVISKIPDSLVCCFPLLDGLRIRGDKRAEQGLIMLRLKI